MTAGRAALAVVLVAGLAGSAHADGKAWALAKARVPDASLAIGVDVEAVAKTKIWAKVAPLLLQQRDAKDVLARVQTACKLDITQVVTSLAIVVDTAKDESAVFLAMPSVGATKALACLQAVAAHDKMTVKQDGELVEVSDGKQSVFVGLVGDVVVATSSWTDKPKVKAWLAGAGAFGKGALGKLLAKVPATATAFAGTTAVKQLATTIAPGVQQVYGWGTIAGGKLAAEVHADYGDVTTASNSTVDANRALARTVANPPLAALGPILKTLTIAAKSSEMIIQDSVAEADVVALLDAVLASH